MDRRLDKGTPYDAETFEALVRLRRWSPDDLVLDIGANDGHSALRFTRYLNRPRIHGCEPVSSIHDMLVERTAGCRT